MQIRIASPLCCSPSVAETLSESEAEQLAAVFKALADPIRLRLINIICRSGEACACDLPAVLDRSQPTISHHLKVLTDAGLVEREQRGKWAWFRLRPGQFEAIGAVLGDAA